MVAALVVLASCVLLLTLVVFQLLKQQGRILLRLDNIEQRMSDPLPPASRGRLSPSRGGEWGLAIGTLVPEFRLRDLSGNNVAVSDFRGRRLMLVYWNPECGFCDMMAADLAKMQDGLKENNTELVLLSYGSAESNRKMAEEHGLKCTVLLLVEAADKNWARLFETCGTPSAYLIDEQGHIAHELVSGMDEVLKVARECASDPLPPELRAAALPLKRGRILPVSESRIERDGLKAGVQAPEFTLPAINGQTVSLDQFRGRKVLLVFSDPQCGPCNVLAPDLVRFHSEHGNNGVAVVMIGRGDEEQNRKKAAEHGISFPVVLQERWKLSRQYGIFATPVAFLISKDGVIMRDVAKGADEIMQLAHESLASA